MQNKQIVFTSPNTAELMDNTVPDEPKKHQVLVKTHFSAISTGTERANLIGEINVDGSKVLKEAVFPRYYGYSSSGVVEKVGSEVKKIKPGDRVINYFGKHSLYNMMPEKNVIKIDDDISLREAAFIVIASFSIEAIRKTKVEIGESALVAGLGILGLFAVSLYRAAGAVPVIAADPNPERRKLALLLGADYTLDPLDEDYYKKVKALTQNNGINSAVEVSGISTALVQTLGCMARFGRVALLGCTRHPDSNIDFYHQVHYPGVSLIGANNFARPEYESHPGNWTIQDDCRALIKLIKGNRIDINKIIQETHTPENAPAVYKRLAEDYGNFPVGVLFDWTK